MASKLVELVLTCGSWQEAQRIVDHLLEKRLIACAEFLPIKSKFHWQNALQEADEVKLLMHSAAHLFDEVEAEVAKLHSYDTFVLIAMPVSHISEAAAQWFKEVTHE